MHHAHPSRFRDPIRDPDPVLAKQYAALFGRQIGAISQSQVEALAEGLMRGDPLADRVVEESASIAAGECQRMLASAARGGIDSVPGAPDALTALFRALESVPDWLDQEQLEVGARTFRRVGMLGMMVLADFGLMGGYRSAAVAKTLMSTGRLRHGAAERLIHTGRFVIAATEPGQLGVGRSGYVSAVQVRLLHARIRDRLARLPSWDAQRWGLPINQSDMLGTNLLFSIGYLEGAKCWGFRFSNDEMTAVIHLWRYVGHLLGVDHPLMPRDLESARRALYLVGVSQPEPDQDSRELARALYEVPLTFAKTRLAKQLVRVEMGLRISMSRRIVGEAGIDQLGLPRSRMRACAPALISTVRTIDTLRARVPFGDSAAYRIGDLFVKLGQGAIERKLRALDERERHAGAVSARAPAGRPDGLRAASSP